MPLEHGIGVRAPARQHQSASLPAGRQVSRDQEYRIYKTIVSSGVG